MPPKKRGSEIQLARGRLKGVLQDLVAVSDDEQSDESEKKYPAPTRGRPPKRLRKEPEESPPATGPVHESYIMKLFDRSLDLAKYSENTPLYPICRAWMADQSRPSSGKSSRSQRSSSPEKREDGDEMLKDLKDGIIDDIVSMPAIKQFDISRVPSPIPEQKNADKDEIDLDYDINSPLVTREVLLLDHQKRWKDVRNKWMNQSKTYQQKYISSFDILEALYKG